MIKGIDAQIMTQRAADYARDVSTQLHRDELGKDFANRMQKLDSQIEATTVTELEEMRYKRVNEDDKERSSQQHEQEKKREQPTIQAEAYLTPADELASVRVGTEQRLLDIEV